MCTFRKTPFDVLIDASGLNCPLPILKTKQALSTMCNKAVLKVIATDPSSALDFPAFAEATGHKLINVEVHKNSFIYYLCVKKNSI